MTVIKNKFLKFHNALAHAIIAAKPADREMLKNLKNTFGHYFALELEKEEKKAAMAENANMALVTAELYLAKCIRPNFADTYADGICALVAKISKLSAVINDMQAVGVTSDLAARRELARKEAAQVAVTALRFMELLHD